MGQYEHFRAEGRQAVTGLLREAWSVRFPNRLPTRPPVRCVALSRWATNEPR